MRHLLNTLYVLTPTTYISLENDNVVVKEDSQIKGRFPLHTLESILYFGYRGASTALLGECAKRNINLCFFTPTGRFLAKTYGKTHGNVLLRKQQYRMSDDDKESCSIARNFVLGKIFNARSVLERAKRDHELAVDTTKLTQASSSLWDALKRAKECTDLEMLRGIEGEAARCYFEVFSEMILQNKQDFLFHGRIKRPPTDNVNALLSFTYTLLANDCTSALEGAGLDSYIGFLHRDRPGRASLALDLMEELRSIYADRFVLTLINNRIITGKDFIVKENGAIFLGDAGRKALLQEWQQKKKDVITHPFLQEKVPWGLIPHIQALLLARYLRGDLDGYPTFLWK